MSKISVIVPVYKVEDYLERCVRSLCRQTHTDLEIILVDDGSPDNSGKLCDDFAQQDSRIRVIHKENGGLSDARNAGMDAATGEYIAFLDSDDWYDPTMLETLLNLAKKHNAQIAECSYRNIYKTHTQMETSCSGKVMEFLPVQAIENNLDWKFCKPVAWNKLYRTDITKGIRYPKGKIHEDEFTTHLFYLAAKKIVYVDIAFVNYERRNMGSITANFKPKNMQACEAFREKAHLIWSRPDLKILSKKVSDCYCVIFLERIKKCEKLYPDCAELKAAIRNINEDFDTLLQHGVDQCFVKELNILFRKYKSLLASKEVQ